MPPGPFAATRQGWYSAREPFYPHAPTVRAHFREVGAGKKNNTGTFVVCQGENAYQKEKNSPHSFGHGACRVGTGAALAHAGRRKTWAPRFAHPTLALAYN
jgi:hypothetical protein